MQCAMCKSNSEIWKNGKKLQIIICDKNFDVKDEEQNEKM